MVSVGLWSGSVYAQNNHISEFNCFVPFFGCELLACMLFKYRIYLIKRPGVYFISKSVKGAFIEHGYKLENG